MHNITLNIAEMLSSKSHTLKPNVKYMEWQYFASTYVYTPNIDPWTERWHDLEDISQLTAILQLAPC